jgi:hypothetical protein
MSKATLAIFVLAISVALSGCLITTSPRHGHKRHKASKRCHPSEYWDGHRCRHKGKAKGHKKGKKHKKHNDHRKKHDHRGNH